MKRTVRFLIAFSLFTITAASAAAAVWVDCTPANVASFANRVHVKCSASFGGGVQYFAVASTDTAYANRFQSLASSALVAGRTVSIFYEPADITGAAWGCQANDCRRALGIAIK